MRKKGKWAILIITNIIISLVIIAKLLWISILWFGILEGERIILTELISFTGSKLYISVICIVITLIISWAINTVLKIFLKWGNLKIGKLILYEGIVYLVIGLIFNTVFFILIYYT